MMEHEQRFKLFLFHHRPNRYQNNNRVLHLYRRGRLFLQALPALSVLLGLVLRLYHLFRFDPLGLPVLLALYHLLDLFHLLHLQGLSALLALLLQRGLLVLLVRLVLYRL